MSKIVKVWRGRQLCNVYGLMGQDGRVRYIGQTRGPLDVRLRYHFKDARKGKSRLADWINSTIGVEIIMLDSFATWNVTEILMIDRYRREGHDLLNVLRGGTDSLHAVRGFIAKPHSGWTCFDWKGQEVLNNADFPAPFRHTRRTVQEKRPHNAVIQQGFGKNISVTSRAIPREMEE